MSFRDLPTPPFGELAGVVETAEASDSGWRAVTSDCGVGRAHLALDWRGHDDSTVDELIVTGWCLHAITAATRSTVLPGISHALADLDVRFFGLRPRPAFACAAEVVHDGDRILTVRAQLTAGVERYADATATVFLHDG